MGAPSVRAISVLLLVLLLLPVSAGASTDGTRKAPETFPLIFELNAGQTSPAVKFVSRGAGYTLFLTPAEMVLGFVTSPLHDGAAVLRMKLAGATSSPASLDSRSCQAR